MGNKTNLILSGRENPSMGVDRGSGCVIIHPDHSPGVRTPKMVVAITCCIETVCDIFFPTTTKTQCITTPPPLQPPRSSPSSPTSMAENSSPMPVPCSCNSPTENYGFPDALTFVSAISATNDTSPISNATFSPNASTPFVSAMKMSTTKRNCEKTLLC